MLKFLRIAALATAAAIAGAAGLGAELIRAAPSR